MASYAYWRSSTNPIHSKDRTSKRRFTSLLHGFPNRRNTPLRNAQETQYARWVFLMDQSTRSFASTITAYYLSTYLPPPSPAFTPPTPTFLLTPPPHHNHP